MRVNKLSVFCIVLLISCSTKTYISDAEKLKGKRVAVAQILLDTDRSKDRVKTDTLCHCIAASAAEAFYPYLQQAGLTVIQLPLTGKPLATSIEHLADSLKLDYIVVGKGIVQFVGRTSFMHDLSLQLVDVKTLEVKASGTFSGPSVTPAGAAMRIGKKMVNHIK